MQLKVKSKSDMVFEWIPYNQFNNIKKINDDNFAKIFSAIWKNDFYYYKYLYEKERIRQVESRVVLKYSQNITCEVNFYYLFDLIMQLILLLICILINRLKNILHPSMEYLKILLQKIIL
jgi:hypothetical protein